MYEPGFLKMFLQLVFAESSCVPGGYPLLTIPSRIHWVIPFLDTKLNALVVIQGYYLEDAPVAYPWGKTGRGNRQVNNLPLPPSRSSFERKIPALNQYNQIVPDDDLTNQDSSPVQTGFSSLGQLTIKVAH